MDNVLLRTILEALLLSAGEPLTLEKMYGAFEEWEKPTLLEMKAALDSLVQSYEGRAMEIVALATGYVVQTRAQFSPWVARLMTERPTKYSRAFLETLAIIAYKQPVTRADIEAIRGVAVNSAILKSLLEQEWIRVAGHRDVPGKPAVYTTTNAFLAQFNLKSLRDLPVIATTTEEA